MCCVPRCVCRQEAAAAALLGRAEAAEGRAGAAEARAAAAEAACWQQATEISQQEARLVQQASLHQAQLAAAGEREQQLAAEVARCRALLEHLQGLPQPVDLAVTADGADEPLSTQPSSQPAEEVAGQAAAAAAAAALLPPGLPSAGFAHFEEAAAAAAAGLAPAATPAFTSSAASGRGRTSGRQRLTSGRTPGCSFIRHRSLGSRPAPADSGDDGGGSGASGGAAAAGQGQEWGQPPELQHQSGGSAAPKAESEDWGRGLFGMFGAGGSSGSGADGVAVGDTSLLQAGVPSGGCGDGSGYGRLGKPAGQSAGATTLPRGAHTCQHPANAQPQPCLNLPGPCMSCCCCRGA